jgi:hypothetical protein
MKKTPLVSQNENPSLHFARLAFHLSKKRLVSRAARLATKLSGKRMAMPFTSENCQ